MRSNCVISDLESLTGKIVRGDITPIVYGLIKDSRYINVFEQSCLDYMSDEEKEEIEKNVSEQNINSNSSEDVSRRPNIEEWLTEFGEPVTVQRKIREGAGRAEIKRV